MSNKKLAIVSTHPIQYNAPLFQLLAQLPDISLKVFYTWSQAQQSVADKEFGREIVWDIPLLKGYDYEFVENISKKPKQSFGGLVNPELIPNIQRWNPDAILVFGWNFSSHFKVMRHFHGKVPVWFRGDSTLLDEAAGIKKILRRCVLRYVYSFVDHAFYVGQNNKEYFIAHGLKESQLTFAPHAIDIARFSDEASSVKGKAWRKKMGYKDDEIIMVFAGKIYSVKNMVSFSKQFVDYITQVPDSKLRLLIIGNGEQESQLACHPFIKRLPFQNQSKMPEVYNVGDVIVLPSISETWGLAINESMAAGKPVVVTDKVGCAPDLVESGTNGFYFSLRDKTVNKDMFKAIETSNLEHIGENNRSKISNWSYQSVATAIRQQLMK